jgi:hypothetical protein
VVALVGGAALFWYHHGAIEHLDQSYKAVGESVASVAQGVAHTIKKVNQVDHYGDLRFEHLAKRLNALVLHGNRNDGGVSFVYAVLATLAGIPLDQDLDPDCAPEDIAQKISLSFLRRAIGAFRRLELDKRGASGENNNNNNDDDE